MMFSKNNKYSKSEIELVKNFLEHLIGKSRDSCQKEVEENGFIFLDKWHTKMGFVKEMENKKLILSLHFKQMKCHSYQVIFKKEGEKWLNSRVINYDMARRKGVVGK